MDKPPPNGGRIKVGGAPFSASAKPSELREPERERELERERRAERHTDEA